MDSFCFFFIYVHSPTILYIYICQKVTPNSKIPRSYATISFGKLSWIALYLQFKKMMLFRNIPMRLLWAIHTVSFSQQMYVIDVLFTCSLTFCHSRIPKCRGKCWDATSALQKNQLNNLCKWYFIYLPWRHRSEALKPRWKKALTYFKTKCFG